MRKRSGRLLMDFAEEIAHLLDVDFPDAEVVVLVMGNFRTHKIGSLYERFRQRLSGRMRGDWRFIIRQGMGVG